MVILVTGGAGYIGSHTIVELLIRNYSVVSIDNFSNSCEKVYERIEMITGKKPIYFSFDLNNENKLDDICKKYKITACIHFAAFKSVSESIKEPLKYYSNNINTTINILKCLKNNNINTFIFSSSCTVYKIGHNAIDESVERGTNLTNPYAKTKYFCEEIIKDYCNINENFNGIILRYFNPIGAHPTGMIGEDPKGEPSNLMPYITQVLCGKRNKLSIFGNNYNTRDGTCIRDFIHVVDLANAHIKALEYNKSNIFNVGTGNGTTVMELVDCVKTVSKQDIPYKIIERRNGDIPIAFCDNKKILNILKWKPIFSIEDACRDSIVWQLNNPNGY